MPTYRKSKKPPYRRRYVKYGGYKTRRPSYVKTRRYRRTPIRRKMPQKRILNLTSTKKRDTMLGFTNSTSTNQSGSTTYLAQPAVVIGTNLNAVFVWCATARAASDGTAPGVPIEQATRTASTCFMRGLKERIEIQCSDGLPWQWRRICFTTKSQFLSVSTSFNVRQLTSNGYVRVMNQLGDPLTSLYPLLFRGQRTSDWNDPMIAPVDTTRVTLKYDKVISIASGNEDGCIRAYSRWHPMNKNLVYDDDEVGASENSNDFSVTSKAGMGDYYVVDIFRPRIGGAVNNQLSINPSSTLYWHEK